MLFLFYRSIIQIVLDLIVLIGLLIFLFIYNFKISFLIVIFLFIIGIIYYSVVKNRIVNWAKIAILNRKKKIQFINETFAAIKEIKIFAIEKYFLKRFRIQNTSLSKIYFKHSFIATLPRHSLEYILFLTIISLIFFLYSNNYSQSSIIQILAVFTLVSFRITPIVSSILGRTQNIKFSLPSFNKLYEEYKHPIHSKKKITKKFRFNKNLTIKLKNFKNENSQVTILKRYIN